MEEVDKPSSPKYRPSLSPGHGKSPGRTRQTWARPAPSTPKGLCFSAKHEHAKAFTFSPLNRTRPLDEGEDQAHIAEIF
jgi:hypothetical protein